MQRVNWCSCASIRKTLQKFFYEAKRKSGAARCATTTETKIARRWLGFFFDLGFHFGGYVAKDFYGNGIFAEGFDGFAELDLALVNLEALRGEGFSDVAGSDGAEELVVLAGALGEAHSDAVDERGLLLRGFELCGGFLGERVANALEGLHVAAGGFNGEL